jgi:CHRD domain-containing protein
MPRRLLFGVVVLVLAAVVFAAVASGQGSNSRRALFGAMNGQKEVSPDGKKGAGDRDGRGSFSAIIQGSRLCYGLSVTGIAAPVAAHIHRGGANVAGPVVIALTQPSTSPGASSACVTARTTLLRAILRNPARYYVNVHTQDFPGGAVRSQLFARST